MNPNGHDYEVPNINARPDELGMELQIDSSPAGSVSHAIKVSETALSVTYTAIASAISDIHNTLVSGDYIKTSQQLMELHKVLGEGI